MDYSNTEKQTFLAFMNYRRGYLCIADLVKIICDETGLEECPVCDVVFRYLRNESICDAVSNIMDLVFKSINKLG